jgi:hypothetical protein
MARTMITKMFTAKGALVLATIVAVPTLGIWQSKAQTRADRPILSILVEDLSSAAAQCGVNGLSLTNEAARVLRNNGVRVTTDRWSGGPRLYVVANILSVDRIGLCIASVRAEISSYIDASRPQGGFRPREKSGSLVLCFSSLVQVWPRGDGKPNLEAVINDCLGQLEY